MSGGQNQHCVRCDSASCIYTATGLLTDVCLLKHSWIHQDFTCESPAAPAKHGINKTFSAAHATKSKQASTSIIFNYASVLWHKPVRAGPRVHPTHTPPAQNTRGWGELLTCCYSGQLPGPDPHLRQCQQSHKILITWITWRPRPAALGAVERFLLEGGSKSWTARER